MSILDEQHSNHFFASFLLFLSSGCRDNNPCAEVIAGDGSINQESWLRIPVVEKKNTIGRKGKSLDCVSVTILNASNYADTLKHEVLRVDNNQLFVSSLRPETVDVILDRKDYYPVKINSLSLAPGENRYEQQVLMYRYDVSFAITGEVGLTLKPNAEIKQVSSIYNIHSPADVTKVPGGHQIRLRYKGTKRTRKQAERLCRQLLDSPYVAAAQPLANFTTVVPGI